MVDALSETVDRQAASMVAVFAGLRDATAFNMDSTTIITTRIKVAEDGTLSVATPLRPGEYVTRIEVGEPAPPDTMRGGIDWGTFPTHDFGPWPGGMTLRREDLYGDDGR